MILNGYGTARETDTDAIKLMNLIIQNEPSLTINRITNYGMNRIFVKMIPYTPTGIRRQNLTYNPRQVLFSFQSIQKSKGRMDKFVSNTPNINFMYLTTIGFYHQKEKDDFFV